MRAINTIRMGGIEVLPLIEGGKGISASTGLSAGHWASTGGVGTLSAVNADSYDGNGNIIPQIYKAKTRRERQLELIDYAVEGGIAQVEIAHELSGGRGRVHANFLWEMGAAETIVTRILESTKGLVHGLTCGAGMPYRLSDIAAKFNIYYYPIVSSGRAFQALWKRSYHKTGELLGGVVYEDPWRAGGHNGLSNSENPLEPQDAYPRVVELRRVMTLLGLKDVPIIMAGGVWWLEEWEHWLDNPEIGPVAFQFGTRPLLTKESPIPMAWKRRLRTLKKGDVYLNRFSPTGFYSSAVNNAFIQELRERSERQVAYSSEPTDLHTVPYGVGPRKRLVFITPEDVVRIQEWEKEGFTEALRTPDSTLVFVAPEKAYEIQQDQANCMGCLSECRFSNWQQKAPNYTTGRRADPRSFCIQKTLQTIAHIEGDGGEEIADHNLMFGGTNAWRFAEDPFYANGYIPTVKELIERILTGK
ncbi:NAD(P)H-dependent flavin oxidoreductase [Entomobacter blattae]|uniref:Uncharacterized protein n=1 Tax=Entomobacter blattae TaxID=2762277 RepID=A0A7H1NPI9_9PROT|nr:nitronate monooxygenase [Entomobacter blattae]QNT77699.1 hypothetical protein JGUZn3_04500 [Entomobacter blattae]